MTRIVIILATAFVAFGGGFLGMLLTMPSVSPDRVAEADSLAAVVQITELPTVREDSVAAEPPADRVLALQDSLLDAQNEVSDLRAQIDVLRSSRQSEESHAANVAGLSATLPKLDSGELAAILEQLDLATLQQLYDAATARNRTLILQALSPERAAEFIRRMVGPAGSAYAAPTTP